MSEPADDDEPEADDPAPRESGVSLHEKVLAARRKRTPGPEPDMSVDPEERARRDARNHKIRERRRADRGETDDPLEGLTAEVVEEVVRRARERLGLGE